MALAADQRELERELNVASRSNPMQGAGFGGLYL